METIDYSGWTFSNLISQINTFYALKSKTNNKEKNKFVLEIGALLYEIKGRLRGEWASQSRKLFPFSGVTAWRYYAVFEAAKDNPELHKEILEKGVASIYRELGLNYKCPERKCDRTDFVVPTMNKKEFLHFYIAYSILNGKDNLIIQELIKNIWKREVNSENIQDIRDFIENEKEIDSDTEKAVSYAIKIQNRDNLEG